MSSPERPAPSASRSWPQRLLLGALLVLPAWFASQAIAGYHQLLGINSYQVTDWIISFGGGFLRRGLSGQLLLLAQRALGRFDLGAFALMLTALSVWAVALAVLVRAKRLPLAPGLALAFSPLLYPLFVYWDPNAVARKDVLAILFVLLLLLLARWRHSAMPALLMLVSAVGLPLLTLSHEALILFVLPADLWLLALVLWPRQRALLPLLLRLALVALPGLLAFAAVSLFGAYPSAERVQAMCSSWQPLQPELICQPLPDPFLALVDPQRFMREIPLAWAGQWRNYRRLLVALAYLLALFLVVLPLVLQAGDSRGAGLASLRRRSGLVALICLLPTLPLYAISTDYGRWLSTTVSIAVLVLLLGEPLWPAPLEPALAPAPPPAGRAPWLDRAALAFALAIAAFAYFKHCCSDDFLLVNQRSPLVQLLKALF
jgi:hypothetical protein